MKIGRICYPVEVLGYGKRVGIWTCGCNKNCYKCMSSELKEWTNAVDYTVDKIINFITEIKADIDGVTISGGEPFLQVEELAELVKKLISINITDILVYTGYSYEYLLSLGKGEQFILDNIAALIDGEYIDKLNNGLGIRGSTNQNIHLFQYHDRYKDLGTYTRKLQLLMTASHTTFIGIPGSER